MVVVMEDMMVMGGVLENPQINIGQGRALPYIYYLWFGLQLAGQKLLVS